MILVADVGVAEARREGVAAEVGVAVLDAAEDLLGHHHVGAGAGGPADHRVAVADAAARFLAGGSPAALAVAEVGQSRIGTDRSCEDERRALEVTSAEAEAARAGMAQKSAEFLATGGKLYVDAAE